MIIGSVDKTAETQVSIDIVSYMCLGYNVSFYHCRFLTD